MSSDTFSEIRYPRTALRTVKAVNHDLDGLLKEIRSKARKGLHLGAGANRISGLINCDLHNPAADMKVDATELDLFDDGSIDVIESHHMIEHLSFQDTVRAIKEWHRVLRPNSLLILTCPDITRICLLWLKYTLAYPIVPRPDEIDYVAKMMVGSQEHQGMFHRNAYDKHRLSRVLASYGFNTEFSYAPYPLRTTPSLLTISRKRP